MPSRLKIKRRNSILEAEQLKAAQEFGKKFIEEVAEVKLAKKPTKKAAKVAQEEE